MKFIDGERQLPKDFWISNITSQRIVSWRGIAFENVCFNHIAQIKRALGISGVSTNEFRKFNFLFAIYSDEMEVHRCLIHVDNGNTTSYNIYGGR